MTTPAQTAQRVIDATTYAPMTDADREAVRRHPLATRRGVITLTEMLMASDAWKACTAPQRALLERVCEAAVLCVLAVGTLPAAALPWLPDEARQSTRDALIRRGMCHDTGQTTAKAVHAYYWCVWMRQGATSGT